MGKKNTTPDTPWTAKRLDQLKALWKEDLPASAIAARLGGGLTRNAVIGKARRIGLSRHGDARPLTTAPRLPKRAPRPKRVKIKPTLTVLQPPDVVPIENDFASRACKWIEGDPKSEWTSCGAPGDPWCPYHKSKVYQLSRESTG